jgi:CheY-specific phosphatase CheX
MTFAEIAALARRMVTELRNGLTRAAHYLRALGVSLDLARAILCV